MKKYCLLFLIFFCLLPVFQAFVHAEPLPANFTSLWSYRNFVKARKVVRSKALSLPKSDYILIYVAVQRQEDRESWSSDPADALHARMFVYNRVTKLIEPQLTDEVSKKLGAEQFYSMAVCGGLGSLDPKDFQLQGNRVTLQQFYAPAADHTNCRTEIFYDTRTKKIVVRKMETGDSSLPATLALERAERNSEALRLLKANKTWDAIKIWKELYGYWKNGPYKTEGPFEEVLNNLGYAYWKVKKYPEAEKILLECKLYYPKRASVYLNLADLYRDMGNKPMAMFYYDYFSGLNITQSQKNYALNELKRLQ